MVKCQSTGQSSGLIFNLLKIEFFEILSQIYPKIAYTFYFSLVQDVDGLKYSYKIDVSNIYLCNVYIIYFYILNLIFLLKQNKINILNQICLMPYDLLWKGVGVENKDNTKV